MSFWARDEPVPVPLRHNKLIRASYDHYETLREAIRMDSQTRRSTKSVRLCDGAPDSSTVRPDNRMYRRLLEDGHRFQFSQALRLLESLFSDDPSPGETSKYSEVPIRIRPSVDLVFPATDVKWIETLESDKVAVVATFMGLYGIDSPLPYYFYEELATGAAETLPHRDFLDVFNHRLYAFYYRAWKKYRPWVDHEANSEDVHSRRFVALAGLGTPEASDTLSVHPLRLAAQAGILGPQARNASGLEAFLEAFFEGVSVEVIENVPRWVSIPSESGLGDEDVQLGRGHAIGKMMYDRSGKFRIRMGPMGVDQYLSLLPGEDGARQLQDLVRLYLPDYLDYDVELQVCADDVPTTTLGKDGATLGYTTSAGDPTGTVVSRVVDYDP